jgi:serine/threonine protein kinase
MMVKLGRASSPNVEDDPFAPASLLGGLGVLGDYQILREIGRGGMGVVYEAEQVSLGRRVALKVLPAAAALDPKQLHRFQVEAHAAACLHHTHIVPIHAVGCERGIPFYVMQLIEGRSLAHLIRDLASHDGLEPAHSAKRNGSTTLQRESDVTTADSPAPGRTILSGGSSSSTRSRAYIHSVAELGVQAAEALEHAHQNGVLHRDIKPANLLLDPRGQLWVTDFGLARVPGDSPLTVTGDLLGTLRYMSPEQALSRRVLIDGRTDTYSLGVTLYELLTLRPAFSGKDRQEVLRRIAEEDPRPIRKINRSVPADLETIIHKAMAKEPEGRYRTAQEMAEDLRRFLGNQTIRARRPSAWEIVVKWGRRHPSLVASTLLILCLLVSSLGVSTTLVRRERDEARRERQRAEANFALARQAVDDYLTKVSEERLLNEPGMQPLRKELLETALKYYQTFLLQYRDDRALQAATADALVRVGKIVDAIGSKPDALSSYEGALAIYRRLAQTAPDRTEFQKGLLSGLIDVGNLRYGIGNTTAAQTSLREATQLLNRLMQTRPGELAFQKELARCQYAMGDLQVHLGAIEEGRAGVLKITQPGPTEFPPVLLRVLACSRSGVTPSPLDRQCGVLIPRSRRAWS